jgi:hypothetical protein
VKEVFMKKYLIMLILSVLVLTGLTAQTHLSVPVDDSVYKFLETAEIRGLCDRLPAAKPYAESLIVSTLLEIEQRRSQLSPGDQGVLDYYLTRFVNKPERNLWRSAKIKIEDDVFPAEAGLGFGAEVSTDMADNPGITGIGHGELYLRGDAGNVFSYGVNAIASATNLSGTTHTINPSNWEPYTFTKVWDGGLHPLSSLGAYRTWSDELAFGIQMNAEISASLWDNRLDLRFGRIRHEWGYGEGSLYLDGLARPFVAFEMTARPWKWLDFSSMFGILEYYVYPEQDPASSSWIQDVAAVQQNNYSILQLDLKPTDWAVLSIWDATIYPKRSELGYPHPFISQFMYQNVTGDFDNMMIGGSIVLDWPEIFRFYGGLYIDEWSLTGGDFFEKDRNMYALQTGIKAPLPIPALPWSRLVFQYTKIEPYTYTHPPTKTPWYTDNYGAAVDAASRDPYFKPAGYDAADQTGWHLYNMETGYMNNGEPMGYHLEPNSDEFLLLWNARPITWISTTFKYRMIRHGGSNVDGSSYLDYIPYYTYTPDWKTDPLYTKDFLKDGEYEWFHIWAVGADFDFRVPDNYPLTVGLKYALVYEYLTDYATNGDFRAVSGSTNFRHLITFQFRYYPY